MNGREVMKKRGRQVVAEGSVIFKEVFRYFGLSLFYFA